MAKHIRRIIPLWVLFFLFPLVLFSQERILEEEDESALSQQDSLYRNALLLLIDKANTAPQRVSLRAYCPPPGDQGSTSLCMVWAAAYGARTISEAILRYPIEAAKVEPYSPHYLIDEHKGCNQPSSLRSVLSKLKTEGVCLMKEALVLDNCHISERNKLNAKAIEHRILNHYTLFNRDDSSPEFKERLLVNALQQKLPVIITVPGILPGFDTIKSNEIWLSKDLRPIPGSHAMVVIGYDETSFEIMNSWGTDWGDQGFARIDRSTLLKWVVSGHTIELPDQKVNFKLGHPQVLIETVDGLSDETIRWKKNEDSVFEFQLHPDEQFYMPLKMHFIPNRNMEEQLSIVPLISVGTSHPVFVSRITDAKDPKVIALPSYGRFTYLGGTEKMVFLLTNLEKSAIQDLQNRWINTRSENDILAYLHEKYSKATPLVFGSEDDDQYSQGILNYKRNQPFIRYFHVVINPKID